MFVGTHCTEKDPNDGTWSNGCFVEKLFGLFVVFIIRREKFCYAMLWCSNGAKSILKSGYQ